MISKLPPHCHTLNEISKFSPPHTSIFISYLPNFSKYALFITNSPPAIIGVRIAYKFWNWLILNAYAIKTTYLCWIPLSALPFGKTEVFPFENQIPIKTPPQISRCSNILKCVHAYYINNRRHNSVGILKLHHKTNNNKRNHAIVAIYTSATLSNKGSSQLTLHSQWLSKKVSTVAVAASAPLTLDLISPSRLSFRTTRTFWILASSSPSSALLKERELQRVLCMCKYLLTVITKIVNKYDFFDEVFRTPVQDTVNKKIFMSK